MQSITRNIITGVLTIIPLYVTGWIVWFVVDLLIGAGRPAVLGFSGALRPSWSGAADLLAAGWFQSALALLLVLFALYALGRAANAVVGRRVLKLVHQLVDAVPFARTIYSATQTLIDALRGDGSFNGQHVVLIEFPRRGMWALGLVTRIFPATNDREELATVYVATTPNPTSGFVEIVPTARLVWLDWSKNDGMAYIVSGGAMAPDAIHLRPSPRPAGS